MLDGSSWFYGNEIHQTLSALHQAMVVLRSNQSVGSFVHRVRMSVEIRSTMHCSMPLPRLQHREPPAGHARAAEKANWALTQHTTVAGFRPGFWRFTESAAQSPTLSGQMCAPASGSTAHQHYMRLLSRLLSIRSMSAFFDS